MSDQLVNFLAKLLGHEAPPTAAIQQASLRRGLEKAFDQATPSIIDACFNALWSHHWFPFIAGAQCRLIEAGVKPGKAWGLARKRLTEFVRDEGVEFGARGYDWSPAGGRAVIEECEIAYWETRS